MISPCNTAWAGENRDSVVEGFVLFSEQR